jgi:predicted GH43/DUF377 family glycosyl hydrolase
MKNMKNAKKIPRAGRRNKPRGAKSSFTAKIKKKIGAVKSRVRAKYASRGERDKVISGVIKRLAPHVLKKHEENPIISPQGDNGWEAWQTFNPGVILLQDREGKPPASRGRERVHFLYRAIGYDGISRLGYASSEDGFKVDERLPYPVYEHRLTGPVFNYYSFASGGSFGGAEDPRPVRVDEEDKIYMTYTACDEWLRVAITSIKVRDFLNKKWQWKYPQLISPPGEIHKNWVIFPGKINGKYAILTSLSPEISVAYLDDLEFENGRYIKSVYIPTCRKNGWDTRVRGAGPPPIKTRYGWLLIYHATHERDPGKYKVGAMLLDLRDPTKIICRSPEPILEPSEVYEYDGFKAGVVYASGAVVKDGKLLLYYGAADSYIGVAYADFDKFLEELIKGIKPELKRKSLKKK